ncbi:MAG TPA: twin-arginine translocation signal domain-containing protein, partial [Acetobacteraceae bacterium]|nr:twin-arginine translocation signal domain-containing protein [Acetobacteraceae bacterium]
MDFAPDRSQAGRLGRSRAQVSSKEGTLMGSHRSDTHDNHGLGVSRRRLIQGLGTAGGAVTLSLVMPRHGWSASAPPQVVIGQLVPFTGSAAEYGTYYRDAADLALQQINAAAKQVFGGPIVAKHLVQDSNTLPTPAIAAARQM